MELGNLIYAASKARGEWGRLLAAFRYGRRQSSHAIEHIYWSGASSGDTAGSRSITNDRVCPASSRDHINGNVQRPLRESAEAELPNIWVGCVPSTLPVA